jgi:hypothetical protein
LAHEAFNIPNDGKFDAIVLDAGRRPELWVGRVDLAELPEFQIREQLDEVKLMKRYFSKDHLFRHKQLLSNYGAAQRAFVSSAPGFPQNQIWGDFSAVVGPENVVDGEWARWVESSANTTEFLFAFGNSFALYPIPPTTGFKRLEEIYPPSHPYRNEIFGGRFGYIGGDPPQFIPVGPTTLYDTNRGHGVLTISDTLRLAQPNTVSRAVFTQFGGSYMGHFGSENNLLRAILADNGHGLTAHWALGTARIRVPSPHYLMGSGATIGESFWNHQQHVSSVDPTGAFTESALMGDPTLRAQIIAPPTNVAVSTVAGGVRISWQAPSGETVQRYRIYRITHADGRAQLLHETTSGTTTSWDFAGGSLTAGYMVRAVKREVVNSGTFWNISQAAFSNSAFVVGVDTRYDFNQDGVLNILDIDNIHFQIVFNSVNANRAIYDLDADSDVDADDGKFLVKRVMGMKYGDANLDWLFSTSDVVVVMIAAEYEDGTENNSTWAEGDWDFDGDYTTADLVLGYQDGYDG